MAYVPEPCDWDAYDKDEYPPLPYEHYLDAYTVEATVKRVLISPEWFKMIDL